jgi:hypothetical protein
MKINDAYEDLDIVFPTEIGTPTLCGNLDRRHFKKIIKKANEAIKTENEANGTSTPSLPVIRLYDLRHNGDLASFQGR